MTATAKSSPSARDLARLEEEAGLEFVEGQWVEKPVSIESSLVEAIVIARFLGCSAALAGKASVFSSSMGYQCFSHDPTMFRKPDVSVVAAERLIGIDPQSGFLKIPPDLAVEVLSPHDLAYEVSAKVEEYLANGFPLIWLVHPNTRAVSVYRADGSISLLHADQIITAEPVLPDFQCKVDDLFPPRPPRANPS